MKFSCSIDSVLDSVGAMAMWYFVSQWVDSFYWIFPAAIICAFRMEITGGEVKEFITSRWRSLF